MYRVIVFIALAAVAMYAAYVYKPDLSSLAPSQEANQQEAISQTNEIESVTMENGLQIQDLKNGEGEEAVAGKKVTVHYTGTLEDGTKFDSSKDRGTPFSFNLGSGMVIQGWEQGIPGMKVGGVRKLTIPSDLGYGDGGFPPTIPGGATLIFEVELLGVE